MVWAEEAIPSSAARTAPLAEPGKHTAELALRLARVGRRKQSAGRWWTLLLGLALLTLGAWCLWRQYDAAFLHMPSVALLLIGGRNFFRGVLGFPA